MKYLTKNWIHAIPYLTIFSIMFIFLYCSTSNIPLLLVWLCVPVYFLHQFEEYIFPGDFVDKYIQVMTNGNTDQMDFLMKTSWWINVPVIWFGFPLCAILAEYVDISFGLFPLFFTFVAIFPHFILLAKAGRNGGLLASIFLNLPISAYGIYYFIAKDVVSTTQIITWVFVTFIFWIVLPIIVKIMANRTNK